LKNLFFLILWSGQVFASLGPPEFKPAPPRQPEKIIEPTIRVRVAQALSEVIISGTDLFRKIHVNEDEKVFPGRKSIRFNCQGFGQKNKAEITDGKPLLLASLVSQTGLLSLADHRFTGTLKIVSSTKNESCDVVHVTTLEDYISTLLAKEMNASWSIEALKAQAVAARTYAYHKIMTQQVSELKGFESFYDLESSERHQVSGTFFDVTERTLEATRATRGMILKTLNGELTETFFHAKCGGHTLQPHMVWTSKIPSYKSVRDPYCHGRGALNGWGTEIKKDRIVSFLNWAHEKNYLKLPKAVTSASRISLGTDMPETATLRMFIDGKQLTFNKSLFRRYFGRVDFESNNFQAHFVANDLHIHGQGRGHGVGLCQIGALGMADKGKKFSEILSHYYPGHKLETLY